MNSTYLLSMALSYTKQPARAVSGKRCCLPRAVVSYLKRSEGRGILGHHLVGGPRRNRRIIALDPEPSKVDRHKEQREPQRKEAQAVEPIVPPANSIALPRSR